MSTSPMDLEAEITERDQRIRELERELDQLNTEQLQTRAELQRRSDLSRSLSPALNLTLSRASCSVGSGGSSASSEQVADLTRQVTKLQSALHTQLSLMRKNAAGQVTNRRSVESFIHASDLTSTWDDKQSGNHDWRTCLIDGSHLRSVDASSPPSSSHCCKGAFGVVLRAVWKSSIQVAVKASNTGDWGSELTTEMQLFLDLHHPHVVACYGILREQRNGMKMCSIVTERCSTNLRAFLNDESQWQEWQGDNMTDDMIDMRKYTILLHVALGLQKLHDMCVLHRDIKCQNILLDGLPGFCNSCKHTGNWKICDFGEAKVLKTPTLTFEWAKKWRAEWTQRLVEQDRICPITSEFMVARGARWYCWLTPGEELGASEGGGGSGAGGGGRTSESGGRASQRPERDAPLQPPARVGRHGAFVYLFGATQHEASSQDCYFDVFSPDCRYTERTTSFQSVPKGLGPFRLLEVTQLRRNALQQTVTLDLARREYRLNLSSQEGVHSLRRQLGSRSLAELIADATEQGVDPVRLDEVLDLGREGGISKGQANRVTSSSSIPEGEVEAEDGDDGFGIGEQFLGLPRQASDIDSQMVVPALIDLMLEPYQITPQEEILQRFYQGSVSARISTPHKLSLSDTQRRRRRWLIPDDATHYVWAYPLPAWKTDNLSGEELARLDPESAEISLASHGGYIYYHQDEEDDSAQSGTVVGINAIGFGSSLPSPSGTIDRPQCNLDTCDSHEPHQCANGEVHVSVSSARGVDAAEPHVELCIDYHHERNTRQPTIGGTYDIGRPITGSPAVAPIWSHYDVRFDHVCEHDSLCAKLFDGDKEIGSTAVRMRDMTGREGWYQLYDGSRRKVGELKMCCTKVDGDPCDNAVTPQYASPEMLVGSDIGLESDVYSFGIVMWEVFTRRNAWHWLPPGPKVGFTLLNKVCVEQLRPRAPRGLSQRCAQMLRRCLHHDPGRRPTIDGVAVWLNDCRRNLKGCIDVTEDKRVSILGKVKEYQMRRQGSQPQSPRRAEPESTWAITNRSDPEARSHWSQRGRYSLLRSTVQSSRTSLSVLSTFVVRIERTTASQWMEEALAGNEAEPAPTELPLAAAEDESVNLTPKKMGIFFSNSWPVVSRIETREKGKGVPTIASLFPDIQIGSRLVRIDTDPCPNSFSDAKASLMEALSRGHPLALEFSAVRQPRAWPKTDGLQAWRVGGLEAIGLVRRHEATLKSCKYNHGRAGPREHCFDRRCGGAHPANTALVCGGCTVLHVPAWRHACMSECSGGAVTAAGAEPEPEAGL